jgi:hypothetical protein
MRRTFTDRLEALERVEAARPPPAPVVEDEPLDVGAVVAETIAAIDAGRVFVTWNEGVQDGVRIRKAFSLWLPWPERGQHYDSALLELLRTANWIKGKLLTTELPDLASWRAWLSMVLEHINEQVV